MKGMNLKGLAIAAVTALALVAIAAPAFAADKGPQRTSTTVTTNSVTVLPPIGDSGRFTPQWMTLAAPAGVTSTVKWIASGVTGTVSTTAASGLLSLTNLPTMFYGDCFTVVSSTDTNGTLLATNSIAVKLIGTVFD